MDSRKKACVALILGLTLKRKVKRRLWTKDWLKKREYSHVVLLKEISESEAEDYKNYFRMSEETFCELLRMVEPFLKRKDTNMRESIPVSEKLAVTLRYLATGRNIEDLKYSAIISPRSISKAILETCEVLIYVLQNYIKFPKSSDEWIDIANDFGKLHEFWNTVGALDGKHIAIKKPAKSGSLYFNYKGYYSIVLLAVVNARKEFVMVDAGMNGRISDGGVMFYSKFGELFHTKSLNLPEPSSLPNTTETFPYFFVADEAFALHENLMKPYAQKNLTEARFEFNKKLSRARVVVENTFGILQSRFGVFQKPITLEPQKAETITMACCYLHNYLAKKSGNFYLQSNESSGATDGLLGLESTKNRHNVSSSKEIRDNLCDYYSREGKF